MRTIGPYLRVLVTAAALALLVWHVDPSDVASTLLGVDLSILLLVALTLAVQFAVIVWRWRIITLNVTAAPVPPALLARGWGASNLYGQLLPASVGGDVIRTFMLARRTGMRDATISVITDRLSGMLVLVLMIAALFPLTLDRVGASGWVLPSLLALAAGLTAVVLFVAFNGWTALLELAARVPRIGKQLSLAIRSGHTPAAMVLGLVIQLLSVLLIYELGAATGAGLRFVDCLLLVPAALLVSALPISVAGWGVREGALVAAFGLIGVPAAAIIPVSVLYGLTAPAIGLAYALTIPFTRNDA